MLVRWVELCREFGRELFGQQRIGKLGKHIEFRERIERCCIKLGGGKLSQLIVHVE